MPVGVAGVKAHPYRDKITADASARIETMEQMVAVPIAETAQMRRLIEFASDTAQLADQRLDLELRELVDDVYRDLQDLTKED